jgi:predicted N-acetyltransferase YhbS
MPEHDDVRIRQAVVTETPLLFQARHNMFADMGVDSSREDLEKVDTALHAFISEHAHLGPIGFIAEDEAGELVGAVSISHEIGTPSMHNPSGRQAYLYGMWVRPSSRRRGVARALVATAVEASRAAGAGAVALMASDEGRPLYEKLGFVAVPAMRLSFEPLFDFHGGEDLAL